MIVLIWQETWRVTGSFWRLTSGAACNDKERRPVARTWRGTDASHGPAKGKRTLCNLLACCLTIKTIMISKGVLISRSSDCYDVRRRLSWPSATECQQPIGGGDCWLNSAACFRTILRYWPVRSWFQTIGYNWEDASLIALQGAHLLEGVAHIDVQQAAAAAANDRDSWRIQGTAFGTIISGRPC